LRLRILLFAGLRDLSGSEELEVEVPGEACRVEALRKAAAARLPALKEARFAIAVGTRYAADGDLVRPGDEVAFPPPVSGG